MKSQKKRLDIICRCNNISRQTIEEAIRNGCRTMNEIFDETSAGVGPCGGSCRRLIVPMLQTFLETGEFPPAPGQPHPSFKRNPHDPNDPQESQ